MYSFVSPSKKRDGSFIVFLFMWRSPNTKNQELRFYMNQIKECI
jgi:hypothetical protein